MIRSEIKNILIAHYDNDFVRVWDWIGEITLNTLNKGVNICGSPILEDSEDIENFIKSLIPTGIEFLQYREDKYSTYPRYRNISKQELNELNIYLSKLKFTYNFDKETNEDYLFGGSEYLIIDLENNKSYIH